MVHLPCLERSDAPGLQLVVADSELHIQVPIQYLIHQRLHQLFLVHIGHRFYVTKKEPLDVDKEQQPLPKIEARVFLV